jgi:hypothetical protein
MDRRAFIAGTLALLAAPLAAKAQPSGKVYRIGLLYGVTGFDPSADPTERALVDGLSEHGYVIGQNLVIELRSAYGKWERLPDLAAELVRIPVDSSSSQVGSRPALPSRQRRRFPSSSEPFMGTLCRRDWSRVLLARAGT